MTACFTMEKSRSRWTQQEVRQFTKVMTRRRRYYADVQRAKSLLDDEAQKARMIQKANQAS